MNVVVLQFRMIVAVIIVVRITVQQGNAGAGVDHVPSVQHIVQKILQPCAVFHQYIGLFHGLHVLHGQRVVVQAGYLLVDDKFHLYAVDPLGDCLSQQIDRVGGGRHLKGGAVCVTLPCAAAGQSQRRADQQGK